MHPPFIFPHHPVHDHLSSPHVKARRTAPAVLRLRPVVQGWPPRPIETGTAARPTLPSGAPVARSVRLTIVPPPRETWRDILGRFLIRVGQRMILQNRPG